MDTEVNKETKRALAKYRNSVYCRIAYIPYKQHVRKKALFYNCAKLQIISCIKPLFFPTKRHNRLHIKARTEATTIAVQAAKVVFGGLNTFESLSYYPKN